MEIIAVCGCVLFYWNVSLKCREWKNDTTKSGISSTYCHDLTMWQVTNRVILISNVMLSTLYFRSSVSHCCFVRLRWSSRLNSKRNTEYKYIPVSAIPSSCFRCRTCYQEICHFGILFIVTPCLLFVWKKSKSICLYSRNSIPLTLYLYQCRFIINFIPMCCNHFI